MIDDRCRVKNINEKKKEKEKDTMFVSKVTRHDERLERTCNI